MATMPQIAMGFQMPQIQLPNQGNTLALIAQLQQAQGANELRRLQAAQLMRAQEQENALLRLTPQDLQNNPAAALAFGAPGRQMYSSLLQGQEARRKAELAEAQTIPEKIKLMRFGLGAVESPEQFASWRAQTARLLPGLADVLPQEFTPDVKRNIMLDAEKLYERVFESIDGGNVREVLALNRYGGGPAETVATREVGARPQTAEQAALTRARTEEAQAGTAVRQAELGGTLPARPAGPTELARLLAERAEIATRDPNSPQLKAYDDRIARLGQAPTTTISVGGETLTPLRKKADEAFAPDYVAWKQGGGVSAIKNAAQIGSVLQQLEEGKPLTGPLIGIQPDVVLSVTNPSAVDARQRVEQVAQESLRAILGAQFTQKEGEAFIARVYNPSLSPQKNAARLRAMFKQIETAAAQKQAMVDYADENGTLAGYRGKIPSINDFYDAINEKPEGRPNTPSAASRSAPMPDVINFRDLRPL